MRIRPRGLCSRGRACPSKQILFFKFYLDSNLGKTSEYITRLFLVSNYVHNVLEIDNPARIVGYRDIEKT